MLTDNPRHEPARPLLVLSACYEPGHALSLSWDWIHDVDGNRLRSPVRRNGLVAREREILDALRVPIDRYLPLANLYGVEAKRFTTEVLPMLRGHPAVVLDIDGEPVSGQPDNGLVDELGAIAGIGRVEGVDDPLRLDLEGLVGDREAPP